MPTYRDQGLVLRAIKLGEADRIITILTSRHGKIRAVARGGGPGPASAPGSNLSYAMIFS